MQATSAQAAASSFSSFPGFSGLFTAKGIFGLILAIVGIILAILANTSSSTDNQTTREAYNVGAAFTLIPAIILIILSTFGFDNFKTFATNVGGRTFFSGFVVLAIVIAIFTALFYNYSPDEAISFSSALLITLLVIVTIGTLYVFSGKEQISASITRFIFSLYFFMPYAFFTFGFIADILTNRLQYIPASFAGLTGVFVNFILGLLMNNGQVPEVTNPLCEIPGLSKLSSVAAPQSMMFTLSSLAYIATYISRSNVGGVSGFVLPENKIWPSWVLYFSLAVFHIFVLYKNGCMMTGRRIATSVVLPLGWGGILGLIGFSIKERSGSPSQQAPSSASLLGSGGIQTCPDGRPPDANGRCGTYSSATPGVGTCTAGVGEGEFVCESFKNGKAETKIITE
jgi:hypothetical protein